MADSQARRVRDYVKNLGQNDRYIVMLYYADGLTPTEISRILNLPNKTIQTRLNELRTHLASLTAPQTRPRKTIPPPPVGPTVSAYA